MRRAHTVAAVRAAEQALAVELPEGALMSRAAAGLAAACLDLLGGAYGRRVAVVAGRGDNGGDALFAAAALSRRGAGVELVVLDPDAVHGAGLAAAVRAGARRVDVPRWDRVDVVLDAVVGIGGRPGLLEPARSLLADARDAGCRVVAVDVPSGVDVDGATTPEPHSVADLTVAFGTHKPALLADPAAAAAGAVHLVDIGLDPYLPAPELEALQPPDVRDLAPAPAPYAHKYSRGVVGVLAGSPTYPGAAVLCVAGALAVGAGMVRYAGPDAVAEAVRAAHPEVVAAAPEDTGRVQAWVVGSGGGDQAADALARALADEVPVVVDADGLTHLPDRLPVPAVLTPHAGELAAMLDVEREQVESEPLAAAHDAARRWDTTVLLKGRRTLVATPGTPTRVNTTGTAWLGTAGAGDVLAGLVGSLLAAGLRPRDAASVGAWLHGAAAASVGGPLAATQVAARVAGVAAATISARDHD